jgi:hypothetical protein
MQGILTFLGGKNCLFFQLREDLFAKGKGPLFEQGR